MGIYDGIAEKDRPTVRKVARKCYVQSGGDPDIARGLLREEFRTYGFSPAVIILLIRVALVLLSFWFSEGVDDPGPTPLEGEPW